jgi:hypothetical protein
LGLAAGTYTHEEIYYDSNTAAVQHAYQVAGIPRPLLETTCIFGR